MDSIRIGMLQASNIALLGEYKGRQAVWADRSPDTLDAMLEMAMVESTVSSNRIEGIVVDPTRARELADGPARPKNRPEQEVAGYRDALSLIHRDHDHLDFSIDTILRLHGTMTAYTTVRGGVWKDEDNLIIDRMKDGSTRVRFTPVPARDTPGTMSDLVQGYADARRDGRNPAILVPLMVLDFLCIHPFRDGNGRMARLLTLLCLYHHGIDVGRYISLERIIEESRATYYESLKLSSQGWHEGRHDVLPWMDYFHGVLIRAYREFEDRAGTVSGRGSKKEQVRLAVGRRTAPFSISDIEADCPTVSRDMVRHELRLMRDEGLIEATGRGRYAKWVRKSSGKGKR